MNYEKIKDNVIKSLNEAELEHVTGGLTESVKQSTLAFSVIIPYVIIVGIFVVKMLNNEERNGEADGFQKAKMDLSNQINDTIAKARHNNESKADTVICTYKSGYRYTVNLTL